MGNRVNTNKPEDREKMGNFNQMGQNLLVRQRHAT